MDDNCPSRYGPSASIRLSATLLLICLLVSAVNASSGSQPALLSESEVTTTTGSKGVMVRPIGDGPFPAVLHLHGSGDTAAANVEALRIFARAGYVALDVDYRGVGSGSIDIQDIYKSLEFLNASRHVRQGAIGLNGFSLGGRLALRIATQRRVLAVSAIAARTTSGSTPTVLAQAEA